MSTFLGHQFALLIGVLVGVVTVSWLGRHVNALVAKIRKAVPTDPPPGVPAADWDLITTTDPRPGEWLGRLERLLFFAMIWCNAWEVVGGWLVFKVGSKWEVWHNIVKVPESLGIEGDALSQLRARHSWGTRVLQSFLVGTLGNVLAGLVAAIVARFAVEAWVIFWS